MFNTEQYAGWKRDTEKYVDIVSGCFLLINAALWNKLDGFDSDFFMYAEDADLCLRAIDSGAKPLIDPNAVIIHYGGASGRVKEEKIIKLFKAKITLLKKHWGRYKFILGKYIFLLYPFNKMVAHKMMAVMNDKYKAESDVWQAIWNRRDEWLNS